MHWAWNQAQLSNMLDLASRRNLGSFDTSVPSKRAQPSDPGDLSDSSSAYGDRSGSAPIPNMPNFPFQPPVPQQSSTMMPTAQTADPSLFPGHLPTSMPDGMFGLQTPFNNDGTVHNLGVPDLGFGFDGIPHSTSMDPAMPYAFSSALTSPPTGVLTTPFNQANSDFNFSMPGQSGEMLNTPVDSTGASSRAYSSRSESYSDSQPDAKRRRYTQGLLEASAKPSLSSFNMDQQMMKLHTRGMFSANMIRVYHDVLEHNLSCWVTEATCPYSGALCRAEGRQTAEWGTSWTNRILDRAMKLDQATKAAGIVKLTRAQDQAASRAIQMAIMAFATQWAQGSNRKNERYGSSNGSDAGSEKTEGSSFNLADDLDRMAQQHFWQEAQRALNDVADVESYVVVCAEVVLGFTQKPWAGEDSIDDPQSPRKGDAFDMDSLMNEISRCIEQDGPPVFLERAVRKANTLKYKTTTAAKAIAKRQGVSKRVAKNQVLSREDEQTAGLLYWLAVMADTISSSMNERPITVGDEDSQHDLVADEDRDGGRWKVDLFIKDNINNPTMKLSWPCSHEDAAENVTIAGPVKILMYRHVSYLQGMLRRGQTGKRLEDVIRSATRIWEYWNKTHGQFFRELVEDSDNVPVRIRGWFFCISSHWHLAALMVVELIELVDEDDFGLENEKLVRMKTGSLSRMKETSLRELSDLAHMSLPPSETDRPPLSMLGDPSLQPEMHHAISEATILSEPWTVILIRAFSKVAAALLKEVDNSRRFSVPPMFGEEEDLRRAEDCIKTLFYLGKKSDMARRVADVLQEAMGSLETPAHYATSSGSRGTSETMFNNLHNDIHSNIYGNRGAYGQGTGNGNRTGMAGLNQRDFMGMAMPTA